MIKNEKDNNDLDLSKGGLIKATKFITNLSNIKREKILELLKKVQNIQKSRLSKTEKASEIKKIMWTNQTPLSKILIGAFIGTIAGVFIFGSGGIGIAGLGGAVGIWGGLAGTVGGVLISSLIQNFEKKPH